MWPPVAYQYTISFFSKMASDLVELILKHLADKESVDTLELAAVWGVDHQRVIGAVKSLQALGNLIAGMLEVITVESSLSCK